MKFQIELLQGFQFLSINITHLTGQKAHYPPGKQNCKYKRFDMEDVVESVALNLNTMKKV